ncbi:hypothetical protein G210_4826 [Candida maltosa Xu316]|uniref:GDP-Man:Man(3)GlcNAc(2)-PP-Dol alpha-1,2-mannosyltransferase n=1 Tax=Candida maltosa (strain Xu316) TaxID=1245528 RepID=M3HRK4_CANMX|nr:hypothetical protein G210_4826 [Candida maltosa Xu316]
MRRRDVTDPNRRIIYGFFHPYANNGGGGERVLWQAVKATLLADDKNICVIYTTNIEAEPLDILKKAESKFQIDGLDHSRVVFIYLRKFSQLIDSAFWKHFTLVGQLFGGMLLGLEAMYELSPDVWIDTQGLPSSYLLPAVSLKIPILAYTHYPILQSDMFAKLKFQKFKDLSKFSLLNVRDYFALGKLVYWSCLYYFYVYLGTKIDIALANGTWTFNHLSTIWTFNSAFGNQLEILYPPCGTEYLTKDVDLTKTRNNKLLYLAQFRPEKRHDLLVKGYAQFLEKNYPNVTKPTDIIPTLVFAGSCRTADDTATLTSLQELVEKRGLSNFVEFRVDISYDEVVELLTTCKFGLNAMWNEHFGIGVVEYVARGCIPLVHASAGPLLDIVGNSNTWKGDNGFFFKSLEDPDFDESLQADTEPGFMVFDINGQLITYPTFDTLLQEIFVKDPISDAKLITLRQNGQQVIEHKFSNKTFTELWIQHINTLDALEKQYREDKRSKVEKVY